MSRLPVNSISKSQAFITQLEARRKLGTRRVARHTYTAYGLNIKETLKGDTLSVHCAIGFPTIAGREIIEG